MKRLALSFAVLVSAIWSMVAAYQMDFSTYKMLKPLTTILVVLIALFSFTKENRTYNKYLTIALLFCLAGDIFLLNNQYFLFGLASFLLGHIVFIYAFSTISGFSRNTAPLIILSLVCLPYFLYLKPGLGDLTIPVAVYMSVIIIMTWQAVSLYFKEKQRVYLVIALGAVLFMVSDSLLAYNKFKAPFRIADAAILTTYWLAIYLFAFTSYFVKNQEVAQ